MKPEHEPEWTRRVREKVAARALLQPRNDPEPELRPIDLATLEAVEAAWDLRLPAGYRDYLLHLTNGGLGPDYGLAPLTESGGMPTPSDAAKPKLLPDPRRPFLLAKRFDIVDDQRKRRPWPVPEGTTPYDGCVVLTDIGCGYFTFLVVNGERAGELWVDYTAAMEDAYVGPLDTTFAPWLERWIDDELRAAISVTVRAGLDGTRVPPKLRAMVERYEGLVATDDPTPLAAVALAELDLFLGRSEKARDRLAAAEALSPRHPSLAATRERVFREDFEAAKGTSTRALASLTQHELADVRLMLAKNEHVTDAILAKLVNPDERSDVRAAVARHPAASSRTLTKLHEMALGRFCATPTRDALFELEAITRHPSSPPELAIEILDTIDLDTPLGPWATRGAAIGASLPAARLGSFATSKRALVRHAIATQTALDPDLVRLLARDPHMLVRLTIASRRKLGRDTFDLLADDESEIVRAMIARHPKAPDDILSRLVADASDTVTYALSSNPRVPDRAKTVLELHPFYSAPDKGEGRGHFGKWLRSAPVGAVTYLALDGTSADAVAKVLLSHPAFPISEVAPHIELQYGMGGHEIAHHPLLFDDLALAKRIAEHSYAYTRRNMAGRSDLLPAMVAKLAHDPSELVRSAIAMRSDLSKAQWAELAHDANDEVRSGAALSPVATADGLTKLSQDEAGYVRRDVLRGPATPATLVAKLARARSADTRKWGALAPHIDDATLTRLLEDRDENVKRWATWRDRANVLARKALR